MKKGDILIEEVSSLEQVGACYDILKKSYAHASVPLADITLFEAAFKVLAPKKMVKFWLARLGDAYIASSVELVYKDVIFGWYGGVDRAYSNRTPTEVLTWRILEWGAAQGYQTYDFGGAGLPDEEYSVRDFKARFGGNLVNYGRNTYTCSRLALAASRAGYEAFRRTLMPLLRKRALT